MSLIAEKSGDGAKAAVVILQEIFRVNGHIRSVADGDAEDGFCAIARCSTAPSATFNSVMDPRTASAA